MKYCITIALCLTSLLGTAEDYISYYNYCNEGDRYVYLKEYELALEQYELGLAAVKYVHVHQLEKASMCAAKVGEFESCAFYAKEAILNGSTANFLNRKAFKNFRRTPQYSSLEASIDQLKTQHLSSINLTYKQLIDSLHYVDQRIIRGNSSVKGNYAIVKDSLPEDRYKLDARNFAVLLELIDLYGFPSEKNIGPAGYANVWALLHHNLRLPENSAYLPMAKSAVENGEYLPRDYAWMYDQSRGYTLQKPLFYYGVSLVKHLSEEEIAQADEERRKLGIKPLAATEIKKRGRGIRQKQLW